VILPPEARPPVSAFVSPFANPTYQRFSTPPVGALLTTGRRTVANVPRTLRHRAPGHRTDYQRVLSRAPWSGPALGCALMRLVPDRLVPDGPVCPVGGDTVDGHNGPKAYGKARHRDPVRPAHPHTAWRSGHRRVVLAVPVRFPLATRPWALPVLIDLYRPEADGRARNRPHRPPAPIRCGPSRLLLARFPGRALVFAGDPSYGTHEVARSCDRHRARLTPVGKLHPDANLFDPPPPYAGPGRPRVKGDRRPEPRAAAAAATAFARVAVGWYGGGKRRVGALGGTGHWHKAGAGLVPGRRVFVRDKTGTPRDGYFSTADPALTPAGSSATTAAGGASKPHSKKRARPSGRNRRAGGARTPPCPPARARSGCPPSSRCWSTRCRKRSGPGRRRGPARRPSRSRPPCAPSAGGGGPKPFCHRRGAVRPFRNSPNPFANYDGPRPPRRPEHPESASVELRTAGKNSAWGSEGLAVPAAASEVSRLFPMVAGTAGPTGRVSSGIYWPSQRAGKKRLGSPRSTGGQSWLPGVEG
jgi:DDE superfamily endonuclease